MRSSPLVSSALLFLIPLGMVAASQSAPLTVLSTTIDASAPLSRSIAPTESTIISRLYFEGQYFNCRGDRFGRANAFSLRCTEKSGMFGTPRVEVLKNGKRHALYENTFDGSVSPDGTSLALQNATVTGKDRVTDQVRIIEISSKAFRRLPLVTCTKNILRWSQKQLITSSDVIHSATEPGYIELCVWDAKGQLLGRARAENIATGTTERPINRVGLLPRETRSLYVLVGKGPQPGGQCTVNVVDLTNASRTASVTFDPALPALYNCSDGSLDSVELDLQNFTMERPTLRFRARQDINAPGDGPVGPWRTAP